MYYFLRHTFGQCPILVSNSILLCVRKYFSVVIKDSRSLPDGDLISSGIAEAFLED